MRYIKVEFFLLTFNFIHMDRFNTLDWVSTVLVIIGAVNWGLIGLFDFNLVSAIFGAFSAVTRIIYVIVGLAGLYMVATAAKMGRHSGARDEMVHHRHARGTA